MCMKYKINFNLRPNMSYNDLKSLHKALGKFLNDPVEVAHIKKSVSSSYVELNFYPNICMKLSRETKDINFIFK